MFPEWQVETSPTFEDSLGMGELTETPLAVVGSHAGMTRAVEGDAFHHHVDAYFVDATATVLLGLHHPLGPFHILGKQVHG